MIQAVIWDIDDTLIDSELLHLKVLLTVSEHHPADISDLPDDRFFGVNMFNDVRQYKNLPPLVDRVPGTGGLMLSD